MRRGSLSETSWELFTYSITPELPFIPSATCQKIPTSKNNICGSNINSKEIDLSATYQKGSTSKNNDNRSSNKNSKVTILKLERRKNNGGGRSGGNQEKSREEEEKKKGEGEGWRMKSISWRRKLLKDQG